MSNIDMSALPPMPWVDGNSRVFGVIAHPVTHVRAPMVFNPRFAAAGPVISWYQLTLRQTIGGNYSGFATYAEFWRSSRDHPAQTGNGQIM